MSAAAPPKKPAPVQKKKTQELEGPMFNILKKKRNPGLRR